MLPISGGHIRKSLLKAFSAADEPYSRILTALISPLKKFS
jgi:hypothetical protein